MQILIKVVVDFDQCIRRLNAQIALTLSLICKTYSFLTFMKSKLISYDCAVDSDDELDNVLASPNNQPSKLVCRRLRLEGEPKTGRVSFVTDKDVVA